MLTRDTAFYRTFFVLSLTLMAERVVVCSVNLLDNVMLGSYSELAMSGAAAVNQLQFIFQQLVYGASNGMVILGSQYWAKGRAEPLRRIAGLGMFWGMGFTVLFFLLSALFPRTMVGLFTSDAQIIDQGAAYLRILCFTYPVFAITTVLLASLRTVKTVQIALRVSILSLVVNCGINFVLIPGRFGAPELGITGAAIGTLTARILECLVVVWYILKRDQKLGLRIRDFFRLDWSLMRDYTGVSIPVVIAEFLWGCTTAIHTAIMGHLSASAIAAQSISVTAFTLLKVTSLGCASATSVIIGQAVGEGDRQKLREYTRTLQVFFLLGGGIVSAVLLLLRAPLLGLYTLSPETTQLANTFILIEAVVLFFNAYHLPMNTGLIRGGGDTKFSVRMDLILIWCFTIPLALLAAFVFHWGPVAVLLCLNADQGLKCIPVAIYGNSYRWVRNLARAGDPGEKH